MSHKSEKNHYEKALISNILGDDSYEQTSEELVHQLVMLAYNGLNPLLFLT